MNSPLNFCCPTAWVHVITNKRRRYSLGVRWLNFVPWLDSASHLGHFGFKIFTSAVSYELVHLYARNYYKYLHLLMYFNLTTDTFTVQKMSIEIHLFTQDHTQVWAYPSVLFHLRGKGQGLISNNGLFALSIGLCFFSSPVNTLTPFVIC